MKKTTLFSLLAMLLLFVGNNVWADDEPFYTLEPVKTTNSGYASYKDVEINGMTWNAPGNQDYGNGAFWRIGGKNLTEVDRDITAKTPMGSAIARIVFNHNGVSRNTVTVNSLKLTVASDEEFATILDEVTLTPSIKMGEAGNVEFLPVATTNAEWPIGAYYKISINVNSGASNGGVDMTSIQFFAPTGGVIVARPVITPDGGVFTEPQTVTITAGEDCTIYYTTDGTAPGYSSDGTTFFGNEYTEPFIVDESCIVKAIAMDVTGASSSIASAEFKFPATYTSIADLCAAATDVEEAVLIEFNGWICTGVKGSNVYFTDGVNGIQLYQSGHGFEMGDMLKGTAQAKLKLYNECAEVMGLTSTTEGLIVEKGIEATPQTVMVADLEKNMQGCLIRLEGVTYLEGKFFDDDDNTITPYNTFIALPELYEEKTYNVTGVAIWYAKDGIWEIAPRAAKEFELVTSQILPLSSWSVESETVDIKDTPTATFTTTSDGVVTYESSDETVATIDENGVITLVGKGTTTITANVAETETYLPDSKSFKLTVTVEGYIDETFAYNDEDIVGQGAPDTGAELYVNRYGVFFLYANKAYAKPDDTHIKIYGSKFETVGEGEDAEKVLTEPSFIQLSVADGYSIVKIVLTATSGDYIKEWTDQFGNAAVIEGTTATWEGDWDEVILTNQATSQARIKTIAVTYIDTDIIDGIADLSGMSGQSESSVIYNLVGQRLSKMQKGINIVGGKKVLGK